MNFSKKGAVGTTMITLVATAAIVIILLIFVSGSSIIKKVDNVKGEVSVIRGKDIGLMDVFDYLVTDYSNNVQERFFIEGGRSLDSSIVEAEKDDWWKK